MINDLMKERSTELPQSSRVTAKGRVKALSLASSSAINDDVVSSIYQHIIDPVAGNRALIQLDTNFRNNAADKIFALLEQTKEARTKTIRRREIAGHEWAKQRNKPFHEAGALQDEGIKMVTA